MSPKDKKVKIVQRTLILNGTKVWLTVLSILVTYGGGSVWWAATTTQGLHDVKVIVESNQVELAKKLDSITFKEFVPIGSPAKADKVDLTDLRTMLAEHTRGK